MTSAERKLGLWSVWGLTISGYLYAAVYIVFSILFPMKVWNGIADFANYFTGAYAAVFTVIQVLAFTLSFFMFLFGAVTYQTASKEKKAAALVGFGSVIIFFMMSAMHYVVQWTSVRAGLDSGNLNGLDMFVMSNFDSPLSIINVVGWTLLLGIASFSFAACFEGGGRMKAIRTGFFINGVSCILTFILYTLGIKLTMLLWTGVLTITWYVFPLLIAHFKGVKSTQVK